ncbi:MAG: hypothetical protein NZ842_04155 [Dehalococcoidia bacterium]|nr:hypothetical protein [Dehalococcoidia bacterium]
MPTYTDGRSGSGTQREEEAVDTVTLWTAGTSSRCTNPTYGGCQVNGPKVAKFLDR